VGVSFGFSIPAIVIASKIEWLTTPWSEIRHIYFRRLGLWVVNIIGHIPGMHKMAYNWEKRLVRGLLEYGIPAALNKNVEESIFNRVDFRWGEAAGRVGGSELKLGLPDMNFETSKEDYLSALVKEPSKMFEGVDSDDEWEDDRQRLSNDVERLRKLVWARYFGKGSSDEDMRHHDDLRAAL
jgi:hypothetical protein